ncbi:MAG TPA: PspA/IM30 family protein [Candidatus Kapabacteria bacterium]|nr:PspA/IM30 family protein [Candidatus Kapabacteria bacterium]
MTVLTRLSRLFRADLHALLDRMEAPDVLLQQAIRDMEGEIQLQQQEQKKRALEQQQLQRRCSDLQERLQQQETELDLCLDAGNDALTRALLRRRLEQEQTLRLLQQRLQTLTEKMRGADTELQQQQRELKALREQAEVLLQTPSFTRDAADACAVTEADVELALLKAKSRRSPA